MTAPLTDRQREILRYVVECWHRGGPMATLRMVSDAFGMVIHASFDHLRALEKKGTIKRVPHSGMRIVLEHPEVREIVAELDRARAVVRPPA